MSARAHRSSLVLGGLRENVTVTTVAGLAGFYAAVLVMCSDILNSIADESGGSVGMLLGTVSTVFIAIALYVATVVMSGCVATVISGRLRQIATLRLLGADARSVRRSVGRGCARAGLVGAVIGVLLGVIVTDLARVVLVARGTLPDADYALIDPAVVLPIPPVIAAAWIAGWVGSLKVLNVSPAQALTSATIEIRDRKRSLLRAGLSVALMVAGGGLLVFAAVLGEDGSGSGFFMAFLASAVSATGVLTGAAFVIPALVRLLSHVLGSDPAARIARRNAVVDPLRTTRSTLGLVVGVTLVTTFASGFAALRTSLANWDLNAAERVEADQVLAMTSTIMICIVVVSCIMAAVGFVSTMSLTVIQRGREIGLLRSLGFTSRQVRTMITKESIALGATAVIFGIALGLFYGSLGAQSLIGSQNDGFVWGVPAPALAVIAISAVVLVLAASRPPAARAVRVTPVEALRIET